MTRKNGIIIGLVIAAVGGVLIFSGGQETPEAPATSIAGVAAQAVTAAAEPEAEGEVPAPDITSALPSPEVLAPAIIPVPPKPEQADVSAECREIFDALKARSGMDKVRSFRQKMTVDMGPMGKLTGLVESEEPKLSFTFAMESQGHTLNMYQVSDGVFMEIGMVGPDGRRTPMTTQDYDRAASMSPMSGDMFNPEHYSFRECAEFTADGAEPLFQKADGTPLDNLNLTRLAAERDGSLMEFFVDREASTMVGMRIYRSDSMLMEMSRIEYSEVAEGVFTAVSLQMNLNGSQFGPGAPANMVMKMSMSDFELNPEIDPSVFSFTPATGR